ncbi:hypothetical protein [Stenotrophomonas sp. SMYL28]|uniref:hypothetical protein n=1 Tax=Stenotrophomonas sp. SMYL28 TaxID=3076049 RepID=UPI002E788C0B|nr:hypothetical protein [Stenotrophomonas sp. SMYL28]
MNDEAAVTGPSAAEALADRIVRNGQHRDPADFAAWLQQSPELQAPADAGAVKLATWQRLMKGTTPFPQANFERLANHFLWYDRDNIRECYDMAALGHSMHVCWLLVPGNEAALARYMHRENAPVSVAQARIRVARLSGPWHQCARASKRCPRTRGARCMKHCIAWSACLSWRMCRPRPHCSAGRSCSGRPHAMPCTVPCRPAGASPGERWLWHCFWRAPCWPPSPSSAGRLPAPRAM